jgi:hypothetical protein
MLVHQAPMAVSSLKTLHQHRARFDLQLDQTTTKGHGLTDLFLLCRCLHGLSFWKVYFDPWTTVVHGMFNHMSEL